MISDGKRLLIMMPLLMVAGFYAGRAYEVRRLTQYMKEDANAVNLALDMLEAQWIRAQRLAADSAYCVNNHKERGQTNRPIIPRTNMQNVAMEDDCETEANQKTRHRTAFPAEKAEDREARPRLRRGRL